MRFLKSTQNRMSITFIENLHFMAFVNRKFTKIRQKNYMGKEVRSNNSGNQLHVNLKTGK